MGTELRHYAYNILLEKGKEHELRYPIVDVVETQGELDERPLKHQKHDMWTLLYGTTISKSIVLLIIKF